MNLITLTTDFGTSDWFVGAMKGVILGINPKARVVEITHSIPTGDIRAGAFVLASCFRYFPPQTIHVVVVDPGVGGPRRSVVVQTERYGFIAPDNGLVSWALANESVIRIHQITNESLFLRPVSQTFHGRDVFAPVAARLSKGFPARRVGPSLDDFVRLDWPKPRVRSSSAVGEIIYIDRFGNAITNLNAPDLTTLDPARCEIYVRGRRPFGMAAFYQAVSRGQPSALLGSSGFLEIAVNGGSASKSLRLKIGDPVTVRQRRP